MDFIWQFIAKAGMAFLDAVIKDIVKRERMKQSFQEFIANRQKRANATIELKDNLDEQSADLDKLRQEIESKAGGEKKP
jgi:hypothetical protein